MSRMSLAIASCALCLVLSIFVRVPAFAEVNVGSTVGTEGAQTSNIMKQVDVAGGAATLKKEDPRTFIAFLIQTLLSLTGTIFLVLLVYAGYVRITANGEDDRVKLSTTTAVAAFTGLVIVFVAYGITVFVTARIYNAATYEPVYEENNASPDTVYQRGLNIEAF